MTLIRVPITRGVTVTNWIIVCSLISYRNLACSDVTRLDCCDMISATSELGMTIITLSMFYFMLSYRLAPTNATTVRHGRHAALRPHVIARVTPSSGVGLEVV
jgi:hypothetical protein